MSGKRNKPHLGFAEFIEQIILSARSRSPYQILYHYTNLAGLEGILSSRSFWSTAHDCTNDEAEMLSANEIITDVAKTCGQRAKGAAATVFEMFVMNYADTIITKRRKLYLACFSSQRDNAHLWKMYGREGAGICLGINILNEKSPVSAQSVSLITRVIYSEEEVRANLTKAFESVSRALSGVRPTHDNLQSGLDALYRIAAMNAICAKRKAWEQESEIRLVTFGRKQDSITPKQRPTPGGKIVRYIPVVVRVEGKLISLSEIIVGAKQDIKQAHADVIALLSNCGYQPGCPEYPKISISEATIDQGRVEANDASDQNRHK
jgi:hypothetical protein